MEHGTTLLLDLPGVSVLRVEVEAGGGRVVHVATADEMAAACPDCGVFSTSVKQHRTTAPRDIPYGQNGIALVWHKRRMRCQETLCGRTSFTESIEQVPPYARVTGRCRAAMARSVGDENRSVSEVAAGHGVSWPTTHRAVVAYGDAVLGEPQPVTVLGIDETRRGRPRWTQDASTCRWTRTDRWHTGFVDISGTQGLLGQTLGRRAVNVTDWLDARSPVFRAAITHVAIDPAAGYAAAVRSALPEAVIVVDHFHLIQLANTMVTDVRRRLTRDLRGRRGRKADPEWVNRRRLLTARERLSRNRFARMWNDCLDADPTAELLTAYIIKEHLRDLCATAARGGHRHEISHRLYRFYRWCADADIPEATTLATTIETWWPAVLAFLTTGITNAKTEGTNRLAKDVARRACGFRNPDNHQRRVRLHCTRHARRTTAGVRA
jgi:transposase